MVTVLGVTYSSATSTAVFSAMHDLLRLGFVPILAFYLQEQKYKRLVLGAFIMALILTVFATILKVYLNIPIGHRTYGNDIFKNHIVISYFMVTALFILCVWCHQFKQYRWLLISLAGLIAYYLMFLNTGRIGYIILYIYFAVLAWHKFGFKGVAFVLTAVSLVLLWVYHHSDAFSMRLDQFYVEFQLYLQGTTTSPVGSRFQFLNNSIRLFLQQPWFGFGTGSFIDAYKISFPSESMMTDNPHNQYLYTAVELGLIGLISLIYIFIVQWKLIQQLPSQTRLMAQGLFVSFFIGCCFNSWLKDFTECHFYCFMTALYIPLQKKQSI